MQDSNPIDTASPLVSIIIPVYQVEEYIEECVVSVVNQTYRNLEIIIVDDCGTDNSISIAKKILSDQEIPWKILKHEKNRGLSAARNTGVEHSTGEYFFFLDSDDYLANDCIEKLVTFALKNNTDMLFGNILYQRDNEIYAGRYTRTNGISEETSSLDAYINGKAFPMAWNRLIRKEAYIASGVSFIEGIIHEDEPWTFSLALNIEKVWYTNEAVYYYRQHKESITANKKMDWHWAASLLEGLKVYAENNVTLVNNKSFQHFLTYRFMFLLQNITGIKASWNKKKYICDTMFSLPNLPNKELQQFFIYRFTLVLSTVFPKIWCVYLGERIKKLKAILTSSNHS